MKKILFAITFAILLIGIVSASPLSEFMSNDVTNIQIDIGQNESIVKLMMNTNGTSFDSQNFSYQNFKFYNLAISKLIGAINGEVYFNDSNVQFTNLNIEQGTITSLIFDSFFQKLNLSFTSNDINNNITIINNYLNNFSINSTRIFSKLKKEGIEYTLYADKGIGDVPSNYKTEIESIINQTMHSINLLDLVSQFIPFIDKDQKAIFDNLDFNYTIDVDLSNANLSNGIHTFNLNISHENETITKEISVVLSDIPSLQYENFSTTKKSSSGGGSNSHKIIKKEFPQIEPKQVPQKNQTKPEIKLSNNPPEQNYEKIYILLFVGCVILVSLISWLLFKKPKTLSSINNSK